MAVIPIPRPRAVVAVYALTVFVSAFLLFAVQPIIGKYILPWFGGSPSVWTSCMLFFQVLLLGGYAYAHFSVRALRPRTGVAVHVVLLAAALLLLPIIPADRLKPGAGDEPIKRILVMLALSLGLPYLVLSATGPLLQAWFARLAPGVSPYRLYALSNAGSLLALLSYPFVIEPNLSRVGQAVVWSWAMGGFALLCGLCGLMLWRRGADALPAAELSGWHESTPRAHLFLWVALPAAASMLLLATTNTICQDIAVVPLLWIVPLGLYLLTFIIAFDHQRWYFRPVWLPLLIVAMAASCYMLLGSSKHPIDVQVGTYCGAMFVCSMVCHGELVRLRPSPTRLTAYYLCIAAGGAVGGLLVSIGAPVFLKSYVELHLSLVASASVIILALLLGRRSPFFHGRRPLVWGLITASFVALVGVLHHQTERDDDSPIVTRMRNFYGVLTVLEEDRDQPYHRYILRHGGIIHGAQLIENGVRSVAPTYYGEGSGIYNLLDQYQNSAGRRIAVVGLGTGTLASVARAGDTMLFYEINPLVKKIADEQFTYLADSAGKVEVIFGDARLSMESQPPQNLDIIVLDAFSGDAIPAHLLTRECFETYLRHLRPDGAIAVHISNRHLDLEPVVARLADHFKLSAAVVENSDVADLMIYGSTWVILSRDESLVLSMNGAPPAVKTNVGLWTDDRTDLLRILR